MLKGLKKYYTSDERLNIQEVKWFRTKLFGLILTFVALSLALILAANHLMHDVLGLGYNKMASLTEENRTLQSQVESLTDQMQKLNGTLDHLGRQGNDLRLMVDLPKMDDEVLKGGIGGAVAEPQLAVTSDRTSQILTASMKTLQRLNAEINVQQQSYAEIVERSKFNKEYFAAMPALKPAEGAYSSSGFGLRMHPVLGIFKTHEGLDIICDVGTPVYASGNGTVVMAGQSGGGYGIAVAINHGFGYQSLYAHLSQVVAREGQRVKRGDLIAYSGKTGLVTGPHLHYEVRYKGVCKNPVDFFFDDVNAQSYRAAVASR
jgi:murein DD-endopeptidase MepM/ murein hydrolase activator NlpD